MHRSADEPCSEHATAASPDLRSAEASVQQSASDVSVARGGLLPSVSFDYFYGIQANQFAIYDPAGNRLLGSAAQVSVNVPLWSWGATQSKLRQAQLRVDASEPELNYWQAEAEELRRQLTRSEFVQPIVRR